MARRRADRQLCPLVTATLASAWEVLVESVEQGWARLCGQPLQRVGEDRRGGGHNRHTMHATTALRAAANGRTPGTVRMVVGLGNHGMGGTRHSVGMKAAEHTAQALGLTWRTESDCKGSVAIGTTSGGQPLIFLKPRLLMNVNGKSVAATARKYNIADNEIVLLHDDLDTPLGKVKAKQGGSALGHNGVKSCIATLGSDRMRRVRIGIGRPESRHRVTDHVLSPFINTELKELSEVVYPASHKLLLSWLDLDTATKTDEQPSEPS
eukprot:m.18339 g.18339  ORF g.18339 m.18339 type:complete len:266 (+) comp3584_c0_seq1:105-902(+)